MDKIDSLVNKSHELWKKGHEKDMLSYLSQAIRLCDELDDINRQIELLNEYAGALRCTGHFNRGIRAMNRVLFLLQEHFGTDSISYATALMNLGNIYREKNDLENSKIYFDKSKSIFDNIDTNCYEYTGLLNNMSLLYMQLGDNKLAEQYQLQAIEFMQKDEKYLLPLAISYNNLYEIQKNLGETSLTYLEKSKSILENTVGTNHPLYASVINNIAEFYFNKKDYTSSYDIYKQALEIVTTCYGTSSPSYKSILKNLNYVQDMINKQE